MPPPTSRRATVILGSVLILFVAALVYLVASSLAPRREREFPPSPVGAALAESGIVTLDARDERAWTFFDADRRIVLSRGDTTGWDIAARRHNVITSKPVADIDTSVGPAVPASARWTRTDFGRDTTNAALSHWYRYDLLAHLLRPSDHWFVLHTGEGRWIRFRIVSYYCPKLEAGCVTLEYRQLSLP
jgi:hypothetical protein